MAKPKHNASSTNSLNKRALLARLTICSWSGSRMDRMATDEISNKYGVSTDSGMYVKQLVSKSCFRGMTQVAAEARAVHINRTYPWDDFAYRVLAIEDQQDYVKAMDDLCEKFRDERSKFLKLWPGAVNDAKTNLGKLFNPDHYPSDKEMRDRLDISYEFQEIPESSDHVLATVRDLELAALRRAERVEFTRRLGNAYTAVFMRLKEAAKNSAWSGLQLRGIADELANLNVHDDKSLERVWRDLTDDLEKSCDA